MRIGITDTLKPNLVFYTNWLKRVNPEVVFTVLSHVQQNDETINAVDGLLLTGGGDVDPRYHGASDSLAKSRDVISSRDEFEFNLIDRALGRGLPILGICRGMQVMNVYLGGSLILDLPSTGFEDHARDHEYRLRHRVGIVAGSLLHEIARVDEFDVSSSHHQAVDHLGNGLMASARSTDGVIEAAEWIVKDRTPFLLLVQWHPERMEREFEGPASGALAERFLKEVKQSTTSRTTTRALHLSEK